MAQKKPSLYRNSKYGSSKRKKSKIKLPSIDLDKYEQLESKLSALDFALLGSKEEKKVENNQKEDYDRKSKEEIKKDKSNNIGNILIVIVLIVMFIALGSLFLGANTPINDTVVNTTTTTHVEPTITLIGNNTLGSVTKEGPYGNANSTEKIAVILGVHPREKGAHAKMEQALKESADSLNCSYYIYRVNVTDNPTDYTKSRENGQNLAQEFIVPNLVNESFDFAIDSHYSDGSWNVERFVFTPVKNNTLSYNISTALSNNFDWLEYYNPDKASSTQYLSIPLNQQGVATIVYEAYTQDDGNVTIEHGKDILNFIDNWNFTSN